MVDLGADRFIRQVSLWTHEAHLGFVKIWNLRNENWSNIFQSELLVMLKQMEQTYV